MNSQAKSSEEEKTKPLPSTELDGKKPVDYDPSWLKGTSAEKAIHSSFSSKPKPSDSKKTDFSDPVYKKISRINGQVNSMNMSELKKALSELKLDIQ